MVSYALTYYLLLLYFVYKHISTNVYIIINVQKEKKLIYQRVLPICNQHRYNYQGWALVNHKSQANYMFFVYFTLSVGILFYDFHLLKL